MRITLQVVQSHAKEPIPGIVLSIENQKYFFNIPDSFQRYFKEHAVRFPKGGKIFLTQLSSDHITGLFGLILTLNAQGLADNSQIFGPPGFCKYLDSIRFLIGHRVLPFSIYDFYNNHEKLVGIKSNAYMQEVFNRKDYESIFFKMNDFLLQQQKTNPELINDAQDFIKQDTFFKDENLEIHPVLLCGEDPSHKLSLCYILKPNKIPGKVNAEKLKANNIQPKYIKKLLEADEVEIEGKIYKQKDFKDPDHPSPLVLIIDCPTIDHLISLANNKRIQSLFADKIDQNEEVVKAIVHLTPSKVLLDAKYNEFLQYFPNDCEHIFVNDEIKPVHTEFKIEKPKKKGAKEEQQVAEKPQYRHFLITNIFAKYFPDHFPVLGDLKLDPKYDLQQLFPSLLKKTTHQKLVEFVLAPVKNEGFSPVVYSDSKYTNFVENEVFLRKYKKWLAINREEPKPDHPVLNLFKNCDPELVFLGTQSMMPSTLCNVSGIYLRFWQQNNIGIILDCGEGSYIQLLNHYGAEKTRQFLKSLRVIYITHIHADHHLGLLQLIRERDRVIAEDHAPKDPVFLVLPFNCGAWVSKFSKMVDNLNYITIFSQHIKIEGSKDDSKVTVQEAKAGILLQETKAVPTQEEVKTTDAKEEGEADDEFEYYEDPEMEQYLLAAEKESLENLPLFKEFLLSKLGITKFNSVDVDHCPQAYGIYLEHADGWRFVYSGDTRPCPTMVQEVGTSTILVHESTFGEELQDHALLKMHSTDREAIEIGMALRAWRTILTHFSPRYGVNSQTKKEKVKDDFYHYSKNNVVKAFDHFGARLSELENMPTLSKCASNMFDEL